MNPVLTNPFRALGLIANSSERELQKQVATLSAYARVGKSIESDCDFPLLPPIHRTEDTIRTAASKIEQPASRLHHALFWFLRIDHVDETALSYLQSNDSTKAAEIWSLAVRDKSITSKNFAAAHNLATLQFLISSLADPLDFEVFEAAVRLKGRAVSAGFDEFSKYVVGDKVFVDRSEVLRLFSDDLIHFSDSYDGREEELVSAFSEFPANVRSYVIGKLTNLPLENIREQIEAAANARLDSPEDADIFGNELYEASIDDLDSLRNIFGPEHPQFQMIANELANELLQCSIDFFNEFVDSDIDPGEDALRLLNYARAIGPTGAVKHRIEENAPTVESWAAAVAGRSRERAIKIDIEFVGSKLTLIEEGKGSSKDAKELVEACTPALASLARNLGENRELYLKVCDAVASNALGLTVAGVNRCQESLSANSSTLPQFYDALTSLKHEVAVGFQVMSLLADMDMSAAMRMRCQDNGRILNRMMGDLGVSARNPSPIPPVASSEAPLFTAPLSTRPGAIGQFTEWLTANSTNWIGVIAVLGVVGLCAFSSLDSTSTNTTKNNIDLGNGNSSNSATAQISSNGHRIANNQLPTLTPTPKTERPQTGAVMSKGVGGAGLGTLTISNGTSSDAIAKLVNLATGKSHREIYIRAGSSSTLSNIAPGAYELLFSMGRDYAPSLRKFLSDAEYSKFDQPLDFQQTRDAYGINYKTFRVTLDKTKFGNASTSTIDESLFDDN